MNADRLIAQYEAIVEAPDSIKQLRRFILDLAIRGRLAPQTENGKLADERFSRELGEYAIPQGWRWSALGDIGIVARGGSPRPIKSFLTDDPDGIPWIKIGDSIKGSLYIEKTEEKIRPAGLKKSRMVYPGDLLLSNSMSFGQPYITQIKGCIHDGWLVIRTPDDVVDKVYLHKVFLSNYAKSAFTALAAGAVVQNLNADKVRLFRIPLPPLYEQRRIVVKVDELMGLCDRLQASRKEREERRSRLTTLSFARLTASVPSTHGDARFVHDSLPVLTACADQVAALRKTVLDLAIRGMLVVQDDSEEPSSDQLNKIEMERESLVSSRAIKRNRALAAIAADEHPFEIPRSWTWSRIGSAVLFTQYGTSQQSNRGDVGVPVLAMGNIQQGSVVFGNDKRIPETSEELPALFMKKFDLLYNRTNSAELVGKTGIYLGADNAYTFASYLIRIRPSLCFGFPQYLNLAMNAPVFRETQIIPLIKKQTGQANVNGTSLSNMLVPIPPLAEQRRIVAKVDHLMALCDQLEKNLIAAEETRSRLLHSLLTEALQDSSDAMAA